MEVNLDACVGSLGNYPELSGFFFFFFKYVDKQTFSVNELCQSGYHRYQFFSFVCCFFSMFEQHSGLERDGERGVEHPTFPAIRL